MMTCTGFVFLYASLTCIPVQQPVQAVPPAARFCRSTQPILMSRADTPETQRRVRRHNAAWRAVCEGRK